MARTRQVVDMGGVSRTPTRHRFEQRKGYSKNRVDYDRRRRLNKRGADTVAFMQVLRGDVCATCGDRPTGERLAIDHIVPLEAGGSDHWSNMTALCRPCNASKKNRDLLRWLRGR